jgi:hypothetical protein
VQCRQKQKVVAKKQPISDLDAADETTLPKDDLQRLVRGLKRQRTAIQEQLVIAESTIEMRELDYYAEIYNRTPAHLPLALFREEIVEGRYDPADFSADLIWEFWRRQEDFVFPKYISIDDPRERREAYGLRAGELYPPMVTESGEKDRQSAYTAYFDKKALAINNEEAVVKHGVHQCFIQMVSVLESRVRIDSYHGYTAVEGIKYEFTYVEGCPGPDTTLGRRHEDYTGCEFIEKMIAAAKN